MNISFVLPHSEGSGAIRSSISLANGLIAKGHEVRVLVHEDEFSIKGIRRIIRVIWFKIRYPKEINGLNNFKGQVKKFKDITICDFYNDEVVIAKGLWSCKEIKKLKVRGIRKIHNICGQDPWKKDLMREAWLEDIPKVVVASYLKQVVKDVCDRDVTAVISNGIDLSKYYCSVPSGQRDGIGTIYHLSYHKDPKTLLSVLKKLREDCHDVPQRIFGVSRKPHEISRCDYTRFPTTAKAREIYSKSLVWIMASSSEGFPNPILEAMACGCAVVATDCGGPRDIITDGDNGFLTMVGDVDEIVDKVKLLLKDSQLREKMVAKGFETVRKFTWQKSIDRWEAIIRETLK
jgi:glycosyltransferase involved in cell wall biosynthesis